ncbi:MAG: hypothetical protein WCA44_02010 [Acidobacteriaceae bacterium]
MEHESDLDAANGLTEAKSIAADALGDDDAFIEIPALRVSGEQEHELSIVAHAAKAFFAAEHQPHVRRLEGDLAFTGFQEIAGHGSDLIELDGLQSGNKIGPAAPINPKGGQLAFKGGEKETAYNRAQEEKWQHR